MIVNGRTVDADEAERLGIVCRVLPGDALLDEAVAIADQVVSYNGVGLRMTDQAADPADHSCYR